ncbi:conserved hypothetical protein [Neospora caninum Liverpool]|uniref:HIT-type domain-containing protein n=1 Tax=Neospora caninum (strain Liverpool) TaxID=572307 RepID=F0VCY8_NEOCL|nr:conserved hypothetical protein [Neospora caninum Liverpool]CBZ51503.1 conserved hypothetical protein [Neospora caninum Liverpool]|eukprot:XP_003881536.1 conserved hypothetical protein [Neospora caninum Liverpool]
MDEELSIGLSAVSTRSAATCQVCRRAVSKYTCPKCRARSCSSKCYKVHNAGRCAKQFQEEQVVEAVKAARVTAIDKRRFELKLSRLRKQELGEEEDEEEEAEDDEEQRKDRREEEEEPGEDSALLEGMDDERHAQLIELAQKGMLDEDSLTEEERRAFHNALGTGALAQYLEPWEPWWQKGSLYAYAHCMRSYNGEVEDVELQEACQHILAIAQALGSTQPPRTPMEALDVALGATSSEAVQCRDPAFNALCLQDLQGVFTCREHAFRAIEEILEMLHGLLLMVAEVQEEEQAEAQRQMAGQRRERANGARREDGEALKKALKERRQYLKTLGRQVQSSERKILFLGSFAWHHWGEVSALLPAALAQVKAKEAQLQVLLKEIKAMDASRAAAARASSMARRCDAIGAVSLAALSPGASGSAGAPRVSPETSLPATARQPFACTPVSTETGRNATRRSLDAGQNTADTSSAGADALPSLTGKSKAEAGGASAADGEDAESSGERDASLAAMGEKDSRSGAEAERPEKREVEAVTLHTRLIEEC